MMIHESGGGIHYSVQETKNASEQKLYDSLVERLDSFKRAGLIELKIIIYCVIDFGKRYFS